jgi:hypothetical protein
MSNCTDFDFVEEARSAEFILQMEINIRFVQNEFRTPFSIVLRRGAGKSAIWFCAFEYLAGVFFYLPQII